MAAVGWGVLKLSAAHSLDVHHKEHRDASDYRGVLPNADETRTQLQ